MTESGDRWNQVNAQILTIAVKFHDFLSCERRFIPPDFAAALEKVAVLHIKLQFIDFVIAASVCQFFEGFQIRNTASGGIVIKTSVKQRRIVCNPYTVKQGTLLGNQLSQRLDGIKHIYGRMPLNDNTVMVNCQAVTVGIQPCIRHKKNIPAVPVTVRQIIGNFVRVTGTGNYRNLYTSHFFN